jgi:hypothetical protein
VGANRIENLATRGTGSDTAVAMGLFILFIQIGRDPDCMKAGYRNWYHWRAAAPSIKVFA